MSTVDDRNAPMTRDRQTERLARRKLTRTATSAAGSRNAAVNGRQATVGPMGPMPRELLTLLLPFLVGMAAAAAATGTALMGGGSVVKPRPCSKARSLFQTLEQIVSFAHAGSCSACVLPRFISAMYNLSYSKNLNEILGMYRHGQSTVLHIVAISCMFLISNTKPEIAPAVTPSECKISNISTG